MLHAYASRGQFPPFECEYKEISPYMYNRELEVSKDDYESVARLFRLIRLGKTLNLHRLTKHQARLCEAYALEVHGKLPSDPAALRFCNQRGMMLAFVKGMKHPELFWAAARLGIEEVMRTQPFDPLTERRSPEEALGLALSLSSAPDSAQDSAPSSDPDFEQKRWVLTNHLDEALDVGAFLDALGQLPTDSLLVLARRAVVLDDAASLERIHRKDSNVLKILCSGPANKYEAALCEGSKVASWLQSALGECYFSAMITALSGGDFEWLQKYGCDLNKIDPVWRAQAHPLSTQGWSANEIERWWLLRTDNKCHIPRRKPSSQRT